MLRMKLEAAETSLAELKFKCQKYEDRIRDLTRSANRVFCHTKTTKLFLKHHMDLEAVSSDEMTISYANLKLACVVFKKCFLKKLCEVTGIQILCLLSFFTDLCFILFCELICCFINSFQMSMKFSSFLYSYFFRSKNHILITWCKLKMHTVPYYVLSRQKRSFLNL
jgi:hypothetical protein